MAPPLSPERLISELGMRPHPEGGHYAETFRDAPQGGRGHSTAIYFLLRSGERSEWHRVRDAAEVWHFHAGAPLRLDTADADGRDARSQILGIDIADGQRPQAVVPANWWQRAESLGEWTLVGCTVAPGFDFASFELAGPDWEPARGR
jgi:predicted cupin superfamily sugar epimerase